MRFAVQLNRLTAPIGDDSGLTSQKVSAQRLKLGDNVIVQSRPRSMGEKLRELAADPMLWFLVATSAIYFVLGDVIEGVILMLAVMPLVGMDAFLHHRTRASTEGLESRMAARARVLRDGRQEDIPARDVVVSDLVLLRAGDLVPADGVLLSATGLQAEESSLTGEAYPVHKRSIVPSELIGEAPVIEGVHWCFAGTRVLTGTGRIRIAQTGGETLYGAIVRSATLGPRTRTPLQVAIGQLVATLAAVSVALCVILAAVRLRQGHGWVDALVSAVTLAVAALPEEFPVAFTFFLGTGIFRLARRQALVRRAVSVENIGRVTVICTDKTGTITEGRLSVTELVPAHGLSEQDLLRTAAQASQGADADPLDVAILAEASERRVSTPASFVSWFPFTEERRRATRVWREGDVFLVATKGTPELIFSLCDLSESERTRWRGHVEALAARGGKVIACAAQQTGAATWRGGEPTRGFALRGLLSCSDPVRTGVVESIRACRDAGLHTLMVTGDHPSTAQAVARAIGLGGGDPRVVLGEDLVRTLNSDGRHLRQIDVIARALPEQKLALVRALQSAGEHVAVTGDGVNDVPALQAADVGIAMGGRGTQSAREAAAIMLLDDNFRSIVRAIAEGRQLLENLRACFKYLLLVHVPLVVTAAFIPFAGYPILYLPVHIVWLELVIHPTALLGFHNRAKSDRLIRTPKARRARFFSARDWGGIAASGLVSTLLIAWGYVHSLSERNDVAHGRGMALAMLALLSVLYLGWLSRFRTRAAQVVAAVTLLGSALLVQIGPLSRALHLAPLHLDDWALALAGSTASGAPMVVLSFMRRRQRS